MTSLFDFDSHAIIGARDYQEDNCAFHLISPASGEIDGTELLAVLADGMGGHVGGARASMISCQRFISHYCSRVSEGGNRFRRALVDCNNAIASCVAADPSLDGMGCTLIGAVLRPEGLRWISVGDSILYLYRDGDLYRLNQDHSFGAFLDKMVRKGDMDVEEAQNDPRRNSLLSAVSGEELDMIDLHDEDIPLDDKDWVILASDGLLTLGKSDIIEIMKRHESDSAADVVQALIQAVSERKEPYQDNTTVMAVRISPDLCGE